MSDSCTASDLPGTWQEAKALGLKHYFTGKPCKHGHVSRRLASDRSCCMCSQMPEAKSASSVRHKQWYQANREKAIADSRAWALANPERAKAKARASYEANKAERLASAKQWAAANPEKRKEVVNKYARANREKSKPVFNAYRRKRFRTDIAYRTLVLLRTRVAIAVRGKTKSDTTMALIGCTKQELIEHLEAQFLPGMNWQNRGEWEIDHIIPCKSFDMTDPAQQRECFNFRNLRPLWRADNRRKGARGVEPLPKGGGYQLTLLVA